MIIPTTTPQEIASLLGTSYQKLMYVVYVKGVSSHYEQFEINKKNGEKRVIRAPNEQLKQLQRRLKIQLEKLYGEPPTAASAFIQKRGIIYNAEQHVKKAAVFNIDLEDFYHQINFGRVRGLLMAKPYSLQKDTAQLIAHICCVDKVLPQGAPTSPVISNMICKSLDKKLSFLAQNERAYYTRYADDITFSFRDIEKSSIYKLKGQDYLPSKKLSEIIDDNGFSIKESKTRFKHFYERQTVTGLKVNKKVNVDRRYIRDTRAMLHSLDQGIEEANEINQKKNGDDASRLELVVCGRINYIGMVKGKGSDIFQSLAGKFNAIGLQITIQTDPGVHNTGIDHKLQFHNPKYRARLENNVWVVCFDGLGDSAEYVTGSAFMLKNQHLLTASHIFEKSGIPDKCKVYRIKSPGLKYDAKVIINDTNSDIAVLELIGESLPKFPFLKIAPPLDINKGYKLAAVGFPDLQLGHQSVSILTCTVTNVFTMSTLKYMNVDSDFLGGISGSPIVNIYMQIVGMALRGKNATYHADIDQVVIEGSSVFISAEHFPKF